MFAAILGVLGVAWLAPAPASAAQARLFGGTFGEATSAVADPYPLSGPRAVAVDASSHDIYVSDRQNHRVEKFDPSGHFILMFGIGVDKTAVESPGSTEAERNVCVATSGDTCTVGEGAFSAHDTPLDEPGFIAVDDSSGPSSGDVYLTNGENASAGLIDKFDSSGHIVSGWAAAGRLDGSAVTSPPAPAAGAFGLIRGMTVDPSGNLWVSDQAGAAKAEKTGRLDEFAQDAGFITGWSGEGEPALDATGDIYINGFGTTTKYTTSGSLIGQVAPSKAEIEAFAPEGANFEIRGLAVDAADGELYLDGGEGSNVLENVHGIIKVYGASCHPVITPESPQPGCAATETFGDGVISTHPQGIAIDAASKTLYVADQDGVATFPLRTVPDVTTGRTANVTETSATLTGTVNPSGIELNAGVEGCRFEWGETTAFEHVAPCEQSATQIGSGGEPVEVRAHVTGLQTGTTYHYRLVASNPNDVNPSIDQPSFGADAAFGPPRLDSASALAVASTTATLQAQVNPNGLDTHVRIEYGTEEGLYSQTTSVVDVGAAEAAQLASFHLVGLTPNVTYHYRARAENVLGEGAEAVVGHDQTFTAQGTGGFSLLDQRAWELVSPPDKQGADLNAIGETGVIQAASDGTAITYLANAPTEALPPGNADSAVQVLSARSAAGWSSRDINMPHEVIVGTQSGPGAEYKFFSRDLSQAIVEPLGPLVASVSAEATEETPFLRSDFPPGEPGAICAASCYRPLVTGANVPSGTEFGKPGDCKSNQPCGPTFLGASPDATHVVLSSRAALVVGAPAGSLYEWTAGHLQLVSELPGGGGPAPGTADLALGSRHIGDGPNSARNAISQDGTRVVWSEGAPPRGRSHLYMNDLSSGETLQLDVNRGGSGKGIVDPVFQSASANGSVIFFSDTQQLTPDSGASTEAAELYRCDVVLGEEGTLECALSDLTPVNGGEGAAVQGAIPGAGEDGAIVYFFAKGVLTTTPSSRGEQAEPAGCTHEPSSTCNLYVRRGATTTFVAALSADDFHDWFNDLADQPVRVSPDGEWFAFMSERPLAGYDNRDTSTGGPVAEVYLYNAAANKLRCASCDPIGARPRGVPYVQLKRGLDGGGGRGTWIDSGLVAANVPGWTAINEPSENSRYQDRYLSDSGRLFFNSAGPLVPQDTNGTVDVYEFEPSNIGNCRESSKTFSARQGGCVDLISNGTSARESVFLDASENGDDAFLLTDAQLSRRDTDTAYDVYDARVGGGEPEPAHPVECQGDACQGFMQAPNDPTPGSLTFTGPGNLTPFITAPGRKKQPVKCHKGKKLKHGKSKKLKRGKCVTVKKKTTRHSRRTSHKRRHQQ